MSNIESDTDLRDLLLQDQGPELASVPPLSREEAESILKDLFLRELINAVAETVKDYFEVNDLEITRRSSADS